MVVKYLVHCPARWAGSRAESPVYNMCLWIYSQLPECGVSICPSWWWWSTWSIAQQDRQAVVPRRLPLNMCLRFYSCSYLSVEWVSVHHDDGEVLGPLPSKIGRQSCRIACLLICVSGSAPIATWVWSEYLSIMMVVKYLVQASWGTRSSRSPILIYRSPNACLFAGVIIYRKH